MPKPKRMSPFEYVQYALNTPISAGNRAAEQQTAGPGQPAPSGQEAQPGALPEIDLSSSSSGNLPAMDISPEGQTMKAPPIGDQTFYNFLRYQDKGQLPSGLEPVLFDDSVLFQQTEPNVYERYENAPLDVPGADVMAQEPINADQRQVIRELVRQWNQGLGDAPAFPERRSGSPRGLGADWRFSEG